MLALCILSHRKHSKLSNIYDLFALFQLSHYITSRKLHCIAVYNIMRVCVCVCEGERGTYHTDIECIEQVKGQGSDQIHKQPGCDVVDADGAGVVHHLPRRAHVGGSEVQNDIWNTTHSLARRCGLHHQWRLMGQRFRCSRLASLLSSICIWSNHSWFDRSWKVLFLFSYNI